MRAYQQRGRRAFSLIEVVLSLGLFALVVGVLAQCCQNALLSLEAVARDRAREEDVAFVRRQVLAIKDKAKLEEGGQVETPTAGTAEWRAEVEPGPVSDLIKLKLTVQLPEKDKMAPLTVTRTLYVLRSGWMEAQDKDRLIQERREAIQKARPNPQDWPTR